MNNNLRDQIVKSLFVSNCIKIGKFKLKNGELSKYYFDMKNLIAYPQLIKVIGDEIYNQLKDIEFDIICGIPYGGLPIACYISTTYNKPMIFIRNNTKEYGTQKLIEGEYSPTDKCVIIDDVITTGKSIQECIDILEEKVNIVNIFTILNRQQSISVSRPINSLLYKNDIIKYRLHQIMKIKKTNICFSADLKDTTKIIKILETIGNDIVICKIHFDIINDDNFKESLIDMSIKYNFLIMEDRKFNDISSIVEKQYEKFQNWVDLVTVHSLVSSNVVSKLSGACIVSNMSNNNYDFVSESKLLCIQNPNNVIGLITQYRIIIDELPNILCMTPGISRNTMNIDDQKYRNVTDIDTDIYIIGRSLYNSNNIKEEINHYKSLFDSVKAYKNTSNNMYFDLDNI